LQRELSIPDGGIVVLDAGCGTGLCGPHLRPISSRLIGVDLSEKMIEQAARRELYDELIPAELVGFLADTPARFDLIVSADTLVYFGALEGTFAAAAFASKPDGYFAFSVELLNDQPHEGYRLNASGRYCHGEEYVVASGADQELTQLGTRILSAHTMQDGDTIASLVVRYRLSSNRAIVECPANVALLSKLSDPDRPPAGFILHIPPSVSDLARDRIYVLNRLKPACLEHFDKLQAFADSELQPALSAVEALLESQVVRQTLSALRVEVEEAIAAIAGQALPLAAMCKGMACTHLAQPIDRAVTESAADPRCGLYWAVSPDALALWSGMWSRPADTRCACTAAAIAR
jgi:SAM-dependent methyltransferase